MKVYLVRHGEALGGANDDLRELSDDGRNEVALVAQRMKQAHIAVDATYHSGKLRAQQTAEILLDFIPSARALDVRNGLRPNDDVVDTTLWLNQVNQDVMLVGHEPFMGKLVAQLLTRSAYNGVAMFHTATVCCLQRVHADHWMMNWMINPVICATESDA